LAAMEARDRGAVVPGMVIRNRLKRNRHESSIGNSGEFTPTEAYRLRAFIA
jgi:hypothetical protein